MSWAAEEEPAGGRPDQDVESEAPVTARDETAEPSGEEDPANEADRDAEREAASNAATDEPEGGAHEGTFGEPDSGAEADGQPGAAPDAETLRRERDDYLDLARRAQADFENYKKRAAREMAAAGDRAKGGLVRELLSVVDNLERALASFEGAGSAAGDKDSPAAHLAEGVRLVHSELVGVLERNGIEPFDPRGEAFDPAVHEALSTRAEDGAEAGVVLDVVEKGYRMNGSVLRPARVIVSG